MPRKGDIRGYMGFDFIEEVVEDELSNLNPPVSKKARRIISEKIGTLIREGYPDGRGQAGAIAYSQARRRGFKVPKQNPEEEWGDFLYRHATEWVESGQAPLAADQTAEDYAQWYSDEYDDEEHPPSHPVAFEEWCQTLEHPDER